MYIFLTSFCARIHHSSSQTQYAANDSADTYHTYNPKTRKTSMSKDISEADFEYSVLSENLDTYGTQVESIPLGTTKCVVSSQGSSRSLSLDQIHSNFKSLYKLMDQRERIPMLKDIK